MLADINGNLADLRSEAMASQRFCLRWNNHQSNLLSVFDQLLHDESFVDVTLAVEGQLLRAHKMVLSACSPYFQALFVGHPDKHPIVILKDVPYVDMRSLLDFMYRGEVSVDQDRLTAFLRVAESLRIKGLTEVNEDKCDLPTITSSLLGSQNTVPPPPPNLHRINQIGPHHHVSQKRFHHMSSHPLLGSALTAPKRKRGRPRKLSGSSDTPIGENAGQDAQSLSGTDLVQGSPEMMEMKMGLEFHGEANTGNNSRSGSVGASSIGSNTNSNNLASVNLSGSSAVSSRKDTNEQPTENGTETPESLSRVKRELEPTPSTSAQASDETFARPHSRQGSETYKQEHLPSLPSDITFEIYTTASSSPSMSPVPASSQQQLDQDEQQQQQQHHEISTISSLLTLSTTTTTTTMTTTTTRKNIVEEEHLMDGVDYIGTTPVSGVHFLSDDQAAVMGDDGDDRIIDGDGVGVGVDDGEALSKSEPGDDESEARKQVGWTRIVPESDSTESGHSRVNRDRANEDYLPISKSEPGDAPAEARKQLLEYLIQNDGSVVCKWCGEVLPSRTRWYRHKYKLHVSTQVAQPAPLFKCHSCNAYFKSRKGYIGHLSSRHSDNENDENREEPVNKKNKKTNEIGKGPDWEQQREKEEKLVADIIDRVKRECEAQGETVSRRGYSRRSTVMNS